MFRVRRIYDEVLPGSQSALDQVKAIMRSRFSAVPAEDIDQLGRYLRNPFLKHPAHPACLRGGPIRR